MGRIRLNLEAILKIFILLGFAIFFFIIIQSGKANLYVHPRIIPYMKFGIGAMVILAFFVTRTIVSPRRQKFNILPYLIFILPLVSGFVLPAKVLDSANISSGTFVMGQSGKSDSESTKDAEDGSKLDKDVENVKNSDLDSLDEVTVTPEPTEQINTSEIGTQKEPVPEGNKVVVEDSNYSSWMTMIYSDIDKYAGKEIEMVGFVLKDKELNDRQFVCARLWMTCCAADLQPVGLICEYNKASERQKDTWVKVKGVIKKTEFNGHPNPFIEVKSFEKTQKPKNEYVF
jgi:putative membrane protein